MSEMNEWMRMTTLDLEGRVEVRSINVVLKLKIVIERNVAFWTSSSFPAVPSLLRQFDSTFNATFWFRSTSPHCSLSLSLTQLQLLFFGKFDFDIRRRRTKLKKNIQCFIIIKKVTIKFKARKRERSFNVMGMGYYNNRE